MSYRGLSGWIKKDISSNGLSGLFWTRWILKDWKLAGQRMRATAMAETFQSRFGGAAEKEGKN